MAGSLKSFSILTLRSQLPEQLEGEQQPGEQDQSWLLSPGEGWDKSRLSKRTGDFCSKPSGFPLVIGATIY